jgi:hypothetical protein
MVWWKKEMEHVTAMLHARCRHGTASGDTDTQLVLLD